MLTLNWFQAINKKATLTIETPLSLRPSLKPHYTFELRRQLGNVSVYILSGPDNYRSYTYFGTLDQVTGRIKGAVPIPVIAMWNQVVGGIYAGKGNALENDGWNVQHDGRCPHCGRKLTVPASLAAEVGPVCEMYLKLGVKSLAEVPCTTDRQLALIQNDYWHQALPATLDALRDAAIDAGFTEERAAALVTLTKRCTRKFKDGKSLPREFRALINKVA